MRSGRSSEETGMAQVAWQVVDGRIRYAGRTLAGWVPEVVADLVGAAQPLRVLLFGSVARGVDGPDSDIDLLVVLPTAERASRHELTVMLARAITAPVPVDLLVTAPAEIAERGDLPGILRVALREGRVVYDRAA
jgi:predicted nucleotidyltransferase